MIIHGAMHGVYFTFQVQSVNFVDFCGKYRCSISVLLCVSDDTSYSSSSEDETDEAAKYCMKKVLSISNPPIELWQSYFIIPEMIFVCTVVFCKSMHITVLHMYNLITVYYHSSRLIGSTNPRTTWLGMPLQLLTKTISVMLKTGW